MGVFDRLKRNAHKETEDVPFCCKYDLTKLKEEREMNYKLPEVSIGASYDFTDKIRLIYFSSETFTREFPNDMIGTTMGVSSPFRLPRGMTRKDAYKVVSYLSVKVEEREGVEPASMTSVALVSGLLEKYGFKKLDGYNHGTLHSIGRNIPGGNVGMPLSKLTGVEDLITYGGDEDLFKRSSLSDRYFDWFSEVTYDEIKEIYDSVEYNLENIEAGYEE